MATPAPGMATEGVAPPQAAEEGPQSSRRRWSVFVPCVSPEYLSIDTMDKGSEAVTEMRSPGPACMYICYCELRMREHNTELVQTAERLH